MLVIFSDAILFASESPKQLANTSLGFLWERITDTRAISLDTTPPHVDSSIGIYSDDVTGNYSAGMVWIRIFEMYRCVHTRLYIYHSVHIYIPKKVQVYIDTSPPHVGSSIGIYSDDVRETIVQVCVGIRILEYYNK
jgi:hypothetical protein